MIVPHNSFYRQLKRVNKVKHKKTRCQIWFPIVVQSKLSLFFCHHLYKEEKDNEYDKVIHWILNDAHLQ